MRMPWGKYRDVPLSEIDTSYLEWVLNEASYAKDWLKAAIQEELERRGEGDGSFAQSEHGAEATALPVVRSVIKTWYREMAKKYHPDRTLDDGAAMKAINDGYERLQELFGVSR